MNLTQEKFAECCGIDPKHLQKIEAGKYYNVELATLHALAAQLGRRLPPLSAWPRVKPRKRTAYKRG